jgi:hypothetical protein
MHICIYPGADLEGACRACNFNTKLFIKKEIRLVLSICSVVSIFDYSLR